MKFKNPFVIDKPRFGYDEDQLWNEPPKEFVRTNRSRLTKFIAFDFIKFNLVAILFGILIGRVIYLNSPIIISDGSLQSLSLGIAGASAAILAIIIAFLTFWFGNAVSSMQSIRSHARDELVVLQDIREKVRIYAQDPNEGVQGPLRGKLIALKDKSESFVNALGAVNDRFQKVAFGTTTYYSGKDMYRLDLLTNYTGGQWFVVFAKISGTRQDNEFAKNLWLKANEVFRSTLVQNRFSG